MSLNAGKSCCLCIGPRHDKPCANVSTCDGRQLGLSRVKELRYLGIFIVSSRNFRPKCSLDHAKRSFYRAANSIFGKIGRITSEVVVMELLKTI